MDNIKTDFKIKSNYTEVVLQTEKCSEFAAINSEKHSFLWSFVNDHAKNTSATKETNLFHKKVGFIVGMETPSFGSFIKLVPDVNTEMYLEKSLVIISTGRFKKDLLVNQLEQMISFGLKNRGDFENKNGLPTYLIFFCLETDRK